MAVIFKLIILLILSIAPVIFFGFLIYKRDFDKEPTGTLVMLFLSGIGSAFVTLFLTWILQTFIPFFGYDVESLDVIELIPFVFIGIALIEELSKWIFVYGLEYNDREFNHLYDGIVYAAFVSLGFACFENILYVLSSGVQTAIMRAFLAIPGHLCDGIMMGYYLSLAKLAFVNKNKTLSKKNLILSLLIPTIAHGLYDYLIYASIVSENVIFTLLFYAFVISFFIYSARKVKQFAVLRYNLHPGYVSITKRKNIINNNYNQNNYPQQQNYNQYNYPQQQNYNQYNYPQQINSNMHQYQYINNFNQNGNFVKCCTNCGAKGTGNFCKECGKKML